VKQQIRTRIDT